MSRRLALAAAGIVPVTLVVFLADAAEAVPLCRTMGCMSDRRLKRDIRPI
jgi:hypothetical protein